MPSRQVALLRGINVGGRTMFPTARQRELMAELGYRDVTVHLQTGNIVLADPGTPPEQTARTIEEAVAAELGRPVAVTVRTAAELAATVEANPFPEAVAEPKTLHVVFLAEAPADPGAFDRIDAARFAPDAFRLAGREIYLWCPDGVGRSKLAATVTRTGDAVGGSATARNWNTVTRLLRLTGGA
ncbi:DUF1697 domain-containing protein [Streptomyces sp. NPDC059740]|uniref:DUF1697 domain-containing protein n=1 Tax=Streptomyces sp. NPDC059740 TaxID=3346926 RepID=UPI0036479294